MADEADEADDWEYLPGEEEAVLACASEKIGYELTAEIVTEDPGDLSGAVDTEERWERERRARAYEQCVFELPVAAVDLDEMGWQVAYRHGYALDPEGNPVMEDPLAPWSGR